MSTTALSLRPSSLPKIKACARYKSEENAGPAAARGTMLDGLFRQAMTGAPLDLSGLDEIDKEALFWACNAAQSLAGTHKVETNEENLRITAFGMEGTADALSVEGQWHADLKSGMVRDYYEQMAAYAVGFMERYFLDEWTVYLLFCDAREIQTIRFDYESAQAAVLAVMARRLDADVEPTPCDYCGWCADRFRCGPRMELAAPLVPVMADEGRGTFEAILKDPNRLGEFLHACKVVMDLEDEARKAAKEMIVSSGGKVNVPHCHVSSRKGRKQFPALGLVPLVGKLPPERLFSVFSSVTEEKAKSLFEEAGEELPADAIEQLPGTTSITVR